MFTSFTVSGSALRLMNVGEHGVIAYLTSVDADIIQELKALGLDRGTPVRLIKRFPHFVISTGVRQIALSKRLSQSVYVRLKTTK